MLSNYGRYINERLGKHIVESDEGFAVYSLMPQHKICYIEDIYVKPELRKTAVASRYADEISEKAREAGMTKLMGSVVPTANNSTDSVKVLLAYGFKLLSSEPNIVYFIKDL